MNPYTPQKLPIEDLEWSAFVQIIGEANRAIARYDGTLRAMINPRVLLSPLTTQEAVLSSRIEGTRATLEQVLEHEAEDNHKSPNTETEKDVQEIINYRLALNEATEELNDRPINLNLIKGVHSILLNSVRGKDKRRGEFRLEQNWIGKPGGSMDDASYVPPEPREIEGLMSNLEKYINYDEKDPLVQLAIVHGQFELIHPFLDGNGRVGRILIPLFLYEKNLLAEPTFYISSYFEANREEYYDRLKNISTKDDWSNWIRFFLKAVTEQAKSNSDKARAIFELYDKMKERISEATGSKYAIQALDAIFAKPVFTRSKFIQITGIPDTSAKRILNDLVDNKIISVRKEAQGRKPALLAFGELVRITGREDFVARK